MKYLKIIVTIAGLACLILLVQAMGRVKVPLEMLMNKANTTYRIDKIYNLEGTRVEVPKNCTLIFSKSGRIVNGELVGNKTTIKCGKKTIGVKLSGSWQTKEIKDEWFDSSYLKDNEILGNVNALQSDEIEQNIYLNSKKQYYCTLHDGYVLKLSSNSNIEINTTLILEPTDLGSYDIISIRNKKNIKIQGGKIVGDVVNHLTPSNGKPGEWGMGIIVYASSNVTIENVDIAHCWGDGIYVGGGAEKHLGDNKNASKDVVIRNVNCDDNRRQGISITNVDGLTVEKCSFTNTGLTNYTGPGAGADIEPNVKKGKNQSCKNIIFKDCVFHGNKGPTFFQYNSIQEGQVRNVENIRLENCSFSGLVSSAASSIYFKKCTFEDVEFFVQRSDVHAIFDSCSIVSKNSLVRKENPKDGFVGKLYLEMRNCEINLSDADTWIKEKRIGLFDDIILEDCTIRVPKEVKGGLNSLSAEMLKSLGASRFEYD